MSKVLISWIAYSHDFESLREGSGVRRLKKLSPDSPTVELHKHHWNDYEKHVLLTASDESEDLAFYDLLCWELQRRFENHCVEKRLLKINDPIDLVEITSKVSELLAGYAGDSVEVFVNPGTPQMQAAWYLSAPNFKKNITLFQLRPARYTKDKTRSEKILIDLDHSIFPTNLNIAASLADKPMVQAAKTDAFESPEMIGVYARAADIAKTNDVTALVLGENGTGKELLAQFIHRKSSRAGKPFLAVNCGAFTDELLASELFGHKKGSFTGADKDKTGIFEEADGGTVFLDEIGDISPKMQVTLLRVLQEKEIRPVGSTTSRKVDVRIIAATNRNLADDVRTNRFRMDLYYRLAVAELRLPALRERGAKEIRRLLRHFADSLAPLFNRPSAPIQFEKDAIETICHYSFPGNVRELENLVISLYTFSEGVVTKDMLPPKLFHPEFEAEHPLELDEVVKRHVLKTYKLMAENKQQTAKVLGISKNTLVAKLKDYLENQ